MDSIKSYLVLFRQNPLRLNQSLAASVPNPSDALKNSPLRIVPNDVMQLIARHLTPASAGSFFLTCRQIGLVIGTQYTDGLKTSKDDTLEFLNLLEHDLQDQIVCTFCKKLHSIRNAERYTKKSYCWDGYSTNPAVSGLPLFDTIPTCLKVDQAREADLLIHENFSVTISKMALKNYRLFGNDAQTQRLLRLLSAPENYSDDSSCKSLTTETRAECRMKDGSLFTRKLINYNWECQSSEAPGYMSICPHLHLEKENSIFGVRLYWPDIKIEDVGSTLQQPCQGNIDTDEKNTSRHVHSGLLQCRFCLTVCKLELKHQSRHAISDCNSALAIVIYKQFESEEDWRRHLPPYDSDDEDNEPFEFSKEKISSVFEVDDSGFEPNFTFLSKFYFAWQKAFLDELELVCLAVIMLLLYWHST